MVNLLMRCRDNFDTISLVHDNVQVIFMGTAVYCESAPYANNVMQILPIFSFPLFFNQFSKMLIVPGVQKKRLLLFYVINDEIFT